MFPSLSLRALLRLDAAACAAMALILVPAARPLAAATALPAGLLTGAGLALAAVAVFIAAVSRAPAPWAVRTVVAGNAAWAAASVALIATGRADPNALGAALVLGQAGAVAGIAALEHAAARRAAT
jgi:hypothetical protein